VKKTFQDTFSRGYSGGENKERGKQKIVLEKGTRFSTYSKDGEQGGGELDHESVGTGGGGAKKEK